MQSSFKSEVFFCLVETEGLECWYTRYHWCVACIDALAAGVLAPDFIDKRKPASFVCGATALLLHCTKRSHSGTVQLKSSGGVRPGIAATFVDRYFSQAGPSHAILQEDSDFRLLEPCKNGKNKRLRESPVKSDKTKMPSAANKTIKVFVQEIDRWWRLALSQRRHSHIVHSGRAQLASAFSWSQRPHPLCRKDHCGCFPSSFFSFSRPLGVFTLTVSAGSTRVGTLAGAHSGSNNVLIIENK